jgi:hypothetical protein
MSEPAVSFARVTIAENDFLSVDGCPEGERILTLSTESVCGIRDLMTPGDVPGGRDDI